MALIDINDLKSRLEWTLSVEEESLALGAIEDASELVKFYGLAWTDESVPGIAKAIVYAAVTRYLRNPDGYIQSRAGDETVAWSAEGAMSRGSVSLTKDEIEILAQLSGRGGFDTVELTAWGPSTYPHSGKVSWVPTNPPGKLFPWSEPW